MPLNWQRVKSVKVRIEMIFTVHFSGPSSAISPMCVSMYADGNHWRKWHLTKIFGTVIHSLYLGQGRWSTSSKFKVTGRKCSFLAMDTHYEVTYTFRFARGQQRTCMLWKWSAQPRVRVFSSKWLWRSINVLCTSRHRFHTPCSKYVSPFAWLLQYTAGTMFTTATNLENPAQQGVGPIIPEKTVDETKTKSVLHSHVHILYIYKY